MLASRLVSRSRRLPLLLGAPVALGLVLAACGSASPGASAGHTASSSGGSGASSSGASTTSTLLAVNDRLAKSDDYVVHQDVTADQLSSTVVHKGGAVSGHVTVGGTTYDTVVSGGESWIRGPVSFWAQLFLADPDGAAAQEAQLADKWVRVTGTKAENFLPPTGSDPVFTHPEDTTAGGHETVDGVDTIVYTDPVARTEVDVTTGDAPLPVRVAADDGGTVTSYGQWGAAPDVVVPSGPDVVDGATLLPS